MQSNSIEKRLRWRKRILYDPHELLPRFGREGKYCVEIRVAGHFSSFCPF